MEGKTCLRLLVLFLGLSYLLLSTAVSATRSLKSNNNEIRSSVQELLVDQSDILGMSDTDLLEMSENDIEGRMVLETKDYPGTGANNHHDPPKTPGRA